MFCDEKMSIVCMVNDKLMCCFLGYKSLKMCSDEKVGVQKEIKFEKPIMFQSYVYRGLCPHRHS